MRTLRARLESLERQAVQASCVCPGAVVVRVRGMSLETAPRCPVHSGGRVVWIDPAELNL